MLVTVEFLQGSKDRPKRLVSKANDLSQLTTTCARMQDMLTKVIDYVDGVIVSVLHCWVCGVPYTGRCRVIVASRCGVFVRVYCCSSVVDVQCSLTF